MAYSQATAKADLKTLIQSTLGGDSAGAENLDKFADAFAEWVLNYLSTLQATGTISGIATVVGGSSAGTHTVTGTCSITPGGIT
jgi:hypothetical protein